MNSKKGSVEINMQCHSKDKTLETTNKNKDKVTITCKGGILSVWDFCNEDTNRVTFSLKVGLAVLLVSLLMLCQATYHVFATNIIWSIFTVVIMFEYTVGATFNQGLNRAAGSILAGVLAVSIGQLALRVGQNGEAAILGCSIFIVGAVTSFMKLLPALLPYEHGFRVFLLTYCLIIVSGYQSGCPIRTATERLYAIALGIIVALLVNALICPVWAGDQLHGELVGNFALVADALEECVAKYLANNGSKRPEFQDVVDDFSDKSAYQKCQSMLHSTAKLESLVNSAKWEPPHGSIRKFFYPWSEYAKVCTVLRFCAFEVMELHGVLNSKFQVQALYNVIIAYQKEILDAANDATELIRFLGEDMSNMQKSIKTHLLHRVHNSTERLQHAVNVPLFLVAAARSQDNSSMLQSRLPRTLPATFLPNSSNHMAELDRNPVPNSPYSSRSPRPTPLSRAESYPPMARKWSRRLSSWPSREVDAFVEDDQFSSDYKPKKEALEITDVLSLATFATLHGKLVAQLDRLVEAVDVLSEMANFKQEAL